MARLFVSPEVANNFVVHEYDEVARRSPEVNAAILADYEAGKVVCLKGWKLAYDSAFFASVALENNRPAKKLKSWVDQEGTIEGKPLRKALIQSGAPEHQADRFVAQAESLALQIAPVIDTIFAGMQFRERRFTWRMLETLHEDLHVDSYGEDKDDHLVRAFINLDIVPRLWHTSFSVEALFDRYGDRLTDAEIAEGSPNSLIRLLSERVFGGMANAGFDREPRHAAFFDPGDIWLVDSRKVSHQIMFGRRALTVDYVAEANSMARPALYYQNAVRDYCKRRTNAST
ncbi:hypothetical protein HOU00_gp485 [Caulobacter phage CcrPW]|uniref:Uncharacterized protein n=1 Tax=Caulobacter phage CcrPW TaxID=2283271 RepID=A0A385EAD1_9CAUD|nr:hypothetical protein HOU00_gp485 [Caulobacter phage CcrPW]AXQ68640.1 hypothetical protein CcrPW_gp101 [Caulobacter phage CcrPW]